MGLIADLGGGRTGVDTVIFIDYIEEHLCFLPLIQPLFENVAAGKTTSCDVCVDATGSIEHAFGTLDLDALTPGKVSR